MALKRADSIGGSKGGARDARPPGGPNSFIFMQFSGKKLKNNSTFGSWRTPLGKILDPPLDSATDAEIEKHILQIHEPEVELLAVRIRMLKLIDNFKYVLKMFGTKLLLLFQNFGGHHSFL